MADQVTFDAPRGFVPRSPVGDDETFVAMATFRALPRNQLELVEIEGYPVGKAEETPARIGRRGIIAASRGRRQEPLPAATSTSDGSPPGAPPEISATGPGGGLAAIRAPQAAVPAPGAAGLAAALAQRFRQVTGRR